MKLRPPHVFRVLRPALLQSAGRRIVSLFALLTLAALAAPPLFSQGFEDVATNLSMEENVTYREARRQARESGFQDLEVDILHGRIARSLAQLMQVGSIPTEVGEFAELLETAEARFFVRGQDSEGRPYLRLTLREGYSFSTETHPIQYIFRAHVYLYPAGGAAPAAEPAAQPAADAADANADGNANAAADDGRPQMERVIVQFYRVNYTGKEYSRELRRIIHPNPVDLAQADRKQIGAELEMVNNSNLTLEHYEESSTMRPVWEGADGVPLPLIEGMQPKHSVVLNSPEDPIDYDRQVRILNRYKRLLRRIDRDLRQRLRVEELERGVIIERILDFPM